MSIFVIRPGVQATIQDLGRSGYQQFGVVVGGAMDQVAARVANCLVGNDERHALLELTLSGIELRADQQLLIAICGADMGPCANGEPLPLWRPVLIESGTRITLPKSKSGCRSYLAVAGGFDVPVVMNSHSTYVRGGFGGYEGKSLRSGDQLAIKSVTPDSLSARMIAYFQTNCAYPNWHVGHFAVAANEVALIRIMAGTHYDWLTEQGASDLLTHAFRVSVHSDRMGCRLEGESPITLASHSELMSEAVAEGTVQLPPDGKPIVLLADRQTTGGYPRIAQIASVDLPVFAQLKPGDHVQFVRISYEQAEDLLIEAEQDMILLQSAIALKFNG